jgi:hypothetical protein
VLTPIARQGLEARHSRHRAVKDIFYQATETGRADLLNAIQQARDRQFDDLFGPNLARPVVEPSSVPSAVRAYAARNDWALLDLVALAACTPAPAAKLAEAVAPRALIYQALRMLDDVLDDHATYKGGNPTLLGEFRRDRKLSRLAVAANLLPMAMMLAGPPELSCEDRSLVRETLRGMLLEYGDGKWTFDRYREMAYAKMVAYGQFLYRPVVCCFPEQTCGQLEEFLAKSFYLGQLLNDLHDLMDDLRRGQPNYWALAEDPAITAGAFLNELQQLSDRCDKLELIVQPYAHARLTDLIGYLFQIDPGTH